MPIEKTAFMSRFDWDTLAKRNKHYFTDPALGGLKREQIISLIERWDDNEIDKNVLKTDLFEEALGSDGILSWLYNRYRHVSGMDISLEMVKRAHGNEYAVGSRYISSDVRE
ncbi:MAG: hypothetical protein PHY56_05745, partial [Candidatus Omnitrophica bacterium]|nr:hypothetical protein [Candidatus Omnitrophota bacterium]